MDCEDYDAPSCYRHVERKARVAHRCCECRGHIKPGELYHVHSGIWNGSPDRYKRCADCESFACTLGCVPFGHLDEVALDLHSDQLRAAWLVIRDLRKVAIS